MSQRTSLQAWLESLPDPDAPGEAEIATQLDLPLIERLWARTLAELEPRERACLKARILAEAGERQDLARLARRFSVTPERIRQLAAAALVKAARRCAERCAERGVIGAAAIEATSRRVVAMFGGRLPAADTPARPPGRVKKRRLTPRSPRQP